MILAMIAYWPIGFLSGGSSRCPSGSAPTASGYGFVLGLVAASVMLLTRFFRTLKRMESDPAVYRAVLSTAA